MSDLEIQQRRTAGMPVLSLTGRLDFDTAPGLRKALMKHAGGSESPLILDLSGLEFIDTAGVATLIEAELRWRDGKGRMVLFGLREPIAVAVDTMHVTDLFTVVAGEEEAARAAGAPDATAKA